jgi:aspartate kinase
VSVDDIFTRTLNPGVVLTMIVTGIAYSKDEAQITLRRVADKPGVAAAIFVPLAEANINVDMISQVTSDNTTTTDITFTVPTADFERAMSLLEERKADIGFGALEGARDLVKVSAIGIGMRSHAGVAARAFKAFAEKGIAFAYPTQTTFTAAPDGRMVMPYHSPAPDTRHG